MSIDDLPEDFLEVYNYIAWYGEDYNLHESSVYQRFSGSMTSENIEEIINKLQKLGFIYQPRAYYYRAV